MPRDIVRLPANIKGRDFIIADLHGNKKCLDAVLEKLNLGSDDRLFVAGDLVDRGQDSLGIIEVLAKHPNIHVIRGNHEEMTLTSIAALEKIAEQMLLDNPTSKEKDNPTSKEKIAEQIVENPTSKFTEDEVWKKMHVMRRDPLVSGLINHVQENGGEWVLQLFIKEYQQGLLSSSSTGISQIRMIQDYMNALPYIIHVDGNEEVSDFNVVHADMPIPDRELARRIEKNEGLSAREKYYAIWARPPGSGSHTEFSPYIGRTIFSPIAYCGHNVVGGYLECVGAETSMVLLDGGAYFSNISLYASHIEQKVSGIKGSPQQVRGKHEPILGKAFKSAPAYLKEKHQRYLLQKMALENIDEVVEAAKNGKIREAIQEVLYEINSKIDKLLWEQAIDIEPWNILDYFTVLNVDASAESDKVRVLVEKFAAESDKDRILLEKLIADAVDELEATEMKKELEGLLGGIKWLIHNYNYHHQPEQPFYHYSFWPAPSLMPPLSQQGFFAEDKSEEVSRVALLQKIEELKEKFLAEKKDIYEEGFLDKSLNLDEVVKDAKVLINDINLLIQEYNTRYPDGVVILNYHKEFYDSEKENLYRYFNKSQKEYVSTSLLVEDMKSDLVSAASEYSDEEDIAAEISKYFAKINRVVMEHNIQFEPVIAMITLDSLRHLVDAQNKPKLTS